MSISFISYIKELNTYNTRKVDNEIEVHKSINYLRSSWTITRNRFIDAEHNLEGGSLFSLTSLLFHKEYTSFKGCEKITSLVGVSCMRRKKMKALGESFG
jgi:hypothetical protein